jgi:glycosyltransferase involved in cell wall biosynthesis
MVSLIVASIDRVTELERLLSSLEAQTYRHFEVIIVDQNPDDRLVPLLSRHSRLVIRHLRSKPGLSRARNVGLRAVQGEIVAIPDDDCWYPAWLLESITAWFAAHSEFGILSTTSRNAENIPVGPKWPATARACTKADVWRCAVSTAIFLRSSVCQAVGGFDENIGVGANSKYQSGEETDYVLRGLERGFRMWYEPSLTVHHPPVDSVYRLRRTSYQFGLGAGYVLKAHRYPVHLVSGEFIRSFGGATISLLKGDIARAHAYLLRGSGQLMGYLFAPVPFQRHSDSRI